LIIFTKGVGQNQGVAMLKSIFDKTIAGVDVHILFAMLMDSYILAATRDDAKGSLGSQELLHVSWAQRSSINR
jgi:hypothetical protein